MTEHALWVPFFRAIVVFVYFLLVTAVLIWAERRIVARMQARLGPNRIGPLGALQTLVDGVKMFFKEDVTPAMVDRPVFVLAPLIGVIAGFLSMAVIPIGGEVTLLGETFTLVVSDLNVGVLWILAMGSIHVYSVFLAGWSSNSPYPLMGGVRASAQMISYEIAQGLAVASVVIYTGSLRVGDIVAAQSGDGLIPGMPGWNAIVLFPAFLIFTIGMVAEAGRPPFDLAEAEGELVGGFHTEYSGMKFGMFMLAEFMNVVTMSAIMVTLFFGGPSGPTFGLPDSVAWIMPMFWFFVKMAAFIFFFILLRGALPRYRYDRLMALGWKVLVPVGLVWALVTAAIVLLAEQTVLSTEVRIGLGIAAAVLVGALLFVGAAPEDADAIPDERDPHDDAAQAPGAADRIEDSEEVGT